MNNFDGETPTRDILSDEYVTFNCYAFSRGISLRLRDRVEQLRRNSLYQSNTMNKVFANIPKSTL